MSLICQLTSEDIKQDFTTQRYVRLVKHGTDTEIRVSTEKKTVEKKILPFLPSLKPATFRSRVRLAATDLFPFHNCMRQRQVFHSAWNIAAPVQLAHIDTAQLFSVKTCTTSKT